MSPRNLVLCGFMGAGKSTLARLLAGRLGRELLCMDEVLEERLGAPIAAVFRERGEAAFRAAEAELCRELSQPRGLVVDAGGGAVVDPANRAALAAGGLLLGLEVDVERALARLPRDGRRPLAADADGFRALHAERQAVMAEVPLRFESSHAAPEALAARILATLEVLGEEAPWTRIPVRHPGPPAGGGSYPIHLGPGLLGRAGELLRAAGVEAGAAAVVTNPSVGPLYLEPLRASLAGAGFEVSAVEVPDGEEHKTLATLGEVYPRLLAGGLDRRSPLVALGGGVVGDMTGLAAATFLRGVPFVQVPTSLLAMVDASVGGKTAVDLPQGKNLVGAFKQPALVLIDPDVLETLAPVELAAGMAEVIKHGLIGDPGLFQALAGEGPPLERAALLRRAVQVKVDVVREDPFERGRRAVLNLGHTFGHAIEQVSGFRVRHGHAVGLGLLAACDLALDLGRGDPGLRARVAQALARQGLPRTLSELDPALAHGQDGGLERGRVLAAMVHDKKRVGRALRFVIPEAVGRVVVVEGPPEAKVEAALGPVLA